MGEAGEVNSLLDFETVNQDNALNFLFISVNLKTKRCCILMQKIAIKGGKKKNC